MKYVLNYIWYNVVIEALENNLGINKMINDAKRTEVLSLESLLAKSCVGLQQLMSWADCVADAAG